MEGARAISDDVGRLPVPRSVLESKGKRPPPLTGSPYDTERGLLPGGRRPLRPPTDRRAPLAPGEGEATLRRTVLRAARTPEDLSRALGHIGRLGRDPQRGLEAGPPLPGEAGYGKD
jgi:hypothetical protein